MPDLRAENHGSIVLIYPVTDVGMAWVNENVSVEKGHWHGKGFACEPRYVAPLLEGAANDGLEVSLG